jgi:hypothetical protein
VEARQKPAMKSGSLFARGERMDLLCTNAVLDGTAVGDE